MLPVDGIAVDVAGLHLLHPLLPGRGHRQVHQVSTCYLQQLTRVQLTLVSV